MSKEIENRFVQWDVVVEKLVEVLRNSDSPEPIQDVSNLILDGEIQYHEDGMFVYEPNSEEKNPFSKSKETKLTISEIMGE